MTHSSTSGTETAPARPKRLIPLDLVRGFLIGSAELVPGVSGGTIALVTGVYDQLIDSAAHVVLAAKRLVTGPDRTLRHFPGCGPPTGSSSCPFFSAWRRRESPAAGRWNCSAT